MSVQPERESEIRQRLDALSERPWRRVKGSDESPDDPQRQSVMSHSGYYVAEIPECIDTDETGEQHAEFIANAPADIAWLLEDRARLSEALEAARGTRTRWGLCNDCRWPIEGDEFTSFTHCQRCARLRDLEHAAAENTALRAQLQEAERRLKFAWVCEFCFTAVPRSNLPASWDLVWQCAVCPDCRTRVEADGGYGSVKGGAYANGATDPRAGLKSTNHVDGEVMPAETPEETEASNRAGGFRFQEVGGSTNADGSQVNRLPSAVTPEPRASVSREPARVNCENCQHVGVTLLTIKSKLLGAGFGHDDGCADEGNCTCGAAFRLELMEFIEERSAPSLAKAAALRAAAAVTPEGSREAPGNEETSNG